GVSGVAVVFVFSRLYQSSFSTILADIAVHAAVVAVGLRHSGLGAVGGVALQAPDGGREGGGRQGRDHRQGQQQGQAPPARQLLFHNRFLIRIVSRGGSAPAPQLTAPV